MTERQYNVGFYDDGGKLHLCFKTPTDLEGARERYFRIGDPTCS